MRRTTLATPICRPITHHPLRPTTMRTYRPRPAIAWPAVSAAVRSSPSISWWGVMRPATQATSSRRQRGTSPTSPTIRRTCGARPAAPPRRRRAGHSRTARTTLRAVELIETLDGCADAEVHRKAGEVEDVVSHPEILPYASSAPVHIELTHPRPYAGPVRVLVVEDDPRMATLLPRGFTERATPSTSRMTATTDCGWPPRTSTPRSSWTCSSRDSTASPCVGGSGRRPMGADPSADRHANAVDDPSGGSTQVPTTTSPSPSASTKLAARVRALVHGRAGTHPTVVRVGDLRLDPATHRAWHGEDRTAAVPEGVSLLECSCAIPAKCSTRTHTLDHVWDFAYDGGSNVVDQYVGYLRRR